MFDCVVYCLDNWIVYSLTCAGLTAALVKMLLQIAKSWPPPPPADAQNIAVASARSSVSAPDATSRTSALGELWIRFDVLDRLDRLRSLLSNGFTGSGGKTVAMKSDRKDVQVANVETQVNDDDLELRRDVDFGSTDPQSSALAVGIFIGTKVEVVGHPPDEVSSTKHPPSTSSSATRCNGSVTILPLTDHVEGQATVTWPAREEELERQVDRLTAELTASKQRLKAMFEDNKKLKDRYMLVLIIFLFNPLET